MISVVMEYTHLPFEYGTSDCCSFVGRCLENAGKDNPMLALNYHGEVGALGVIAEFGGLGEAVSHFLGEPRDDTADAEEGDVVLCSFHGEEIVGIVMRCGMEQELRCVLRTERSLVDWPLNRAEQVWST